MPETTRERVRQIVADEPNLNQSEIAARLGVSRERVRQIVTQEGLGVPRGRRGAAPGTRRTGGGGMMLPRLRTGGAPIRVNTTAGGTIGELLVAADLMARGYTVFFPLTRTAKCDLVTVDSDARVERIEVRCGKREASGAVRWNHPDTSRSDRRAIVLTGEPIRFEPPFPGDEALSLSTESGAAP